MALDKTSLKSGIETLLQALITYNGQGDHTQQDAVEYFADGLSNLIETFVKTGEVTVTILTTDVGLQVSTVPPNPTLGPVAIKELGTKGTIA